MKMMKKAAAAAMAAIFAAASLTGCSGTSSSTGSANKNMFSSVAGGASFGNTDYFKMMSTYSRIGVHNMSNYYAVGMMMNSFI